MMGTAPHFLNGVDTFPEHFVYGGRWIGSVLICCVPWSDNVSETEHHSSEMHPNNWALPTYFTGFGGFYLFLP